MSTLNEQRVTDLLARGTEGVVAPPGIAETVIRRQRRQTRRRHLASVAATGVTGLAVAGVLGVTGHPARPGTAAASPPPAARAPGTPRAAGTAVAAPPLRLTASQHELLRLSRAVADAAPASGRYGVLVDDDDGYRRTSVIDGLTGNVETYQTHPGWPSHLSSAAAMPTTAQLAALPLSAPSLRAALLAKAAAEDAAAGHGAGSAQTDQDKVGDQASGLLWNPLVRPDLRSVLLRVLATQTGVSLQPDAVDTLGRPAVKITVATGNGQQAATYVNATTGVVLDSAFLPDVGHDVYLSASTTDTPPAG